MINVTACPQEQKRKEWPGSELLEPDHNLRLRTLTLQVDLGYIPEAPDLSLRPTEMIRGRVPTASSMGVR